MESPAARFWLPTRTTSAPLPKAKVTVTGSGALASRPPTLYNPCTSPRTAEKPRSLALRRLTFTRKCANKMVPLTKVFSSKLPPSSFPSSSHSLSRGAATAAAHLAMGSSSLSTAPKANFVKCDATGERPQRIDSGCSVSSCDQPLPAEPPPPYQLRVANPAPTSPEYDYDYDHIDGRRGAAASSSRFTAASIEAIRAPDSPVPTFPSPKLSTESVFGSIRSLSSLASVSHSSEQRAAPAPRANPNWTGIISDEPRSICTLRNSAARGAGGPAPALRRKNTIGFPRRVHTVLGPRATITALKPSASSAPFRS